VRQARALLVPVPVLLMSSISYHVSPCICNSACMD
jgi:hypothetical protein